MATKAPPTTSFKILLVSCALSLGMGCSQPQEDSFDDIELRDGWWRPVGSVHLSGNTDIVTEYWGSSQMSSSFDRRIGVSYKDVRLDSISKSGNVDSIEVVNGRIVARKGNNTLTGNALEGLRLNFIEDGYWEVQYRISDVIPGTTEEYLIEYRYPQTANHLRHFWNLCDGNGTTAVAFRNAVRDMTSPNGFKRRGHSMSFACTNRAFGKAKTSGFDPEDVSTNEFIAAARMITADYCGTQDSYTNNGTPVLHSPMVYASDVDEVEAGWDEDGAVCLTETRLANSSPNCSLPVCDDHHAEGSDVLVWSKLP